MLRRSCEARLLRHISRGYANDRSKDCALSESDSAVQNSSRRSARKFNYRDRGTNSTGLTRQIIVACSWRISGDLCSCARPLQVAWFSLQKTKQLWRNTPPSSIIIWPLPENKGRRKIVMRRPLFVSIICMLKQKPIDRYFSKITHQ